MDRSWADLQAPDGVKADDPRRSVGPARAGVLGVDIEGNHEAVRALELEGLCALAVGLDLVLHEDEAIVPRRAPLRFLMTIGSLVMPWFRFSTTSAFAAVQFRFARSWVAFGRWTGPSRS